MYKLEINRKQLDIQKILDSGQVFRYIIIEENKEFVLMTKKYYVIVKSEKYGYQFSCDEEEFEKVWYDYLDLGRDYNQVNNRIEIIDPRLKEAINLHQGIRILQQEPFEMLITFIVSQSKAISQIKKLVDQLAIDYGPLLGEYKGYLIYKFPSPLDLKHLSETDFRQMKFGYRAPYLFFGVRMFLEDQQCLKSLADNELKEKLKEIKGVGDKVASCVMLFGYGRHDSFPVDVWMRRIMTKMYFEDEILMNTLEKVKLTDKQIEKFGKDKFKSDAGIAQQYLFEYGRTKLRET